MTTPLFAIASLLISSAGNNIHIGDQANFSGTVSQGAASMDVSLSMKVTGFDAATGQYTVLTTQTVMGTSSSASAARPADQIGDDATAQQVVDNCAAFGGELESVNLTQSTTIEMLNTCKVTQGDSSSQQVINIGVVPFMIVKYVNTQSDGTTTRLNLTSYVRGH